MAMAMSVLAEGRGFGMENMRDDLSSLAPGDTLLVDDMLADALAQWAMDVDGGRAGAVRIGRKNSGYQGLAPKPDDARRGNIGRGYMSQ